MNLVFANIIRETARSRTCSTPTTRLDERPGKTYGIRGIIGEEFRRVTLPSDSVRVRAASERAAILMSTSYRIGPPS